MNTRSIQSVEALVIAAFHHPQLVLENRDPKQMALLKTVLKTLLGGMSG